MLERAPLSEHAPLVVLAIPDRRLDRVLARTPLVVPDEWMVDLEPRLLPEVPQLADHPDRAELRVRERRKIPVERCLGIVTELLEAAHHGVARDRGRPFLELAVEREIAL